MQTEYAGFWIRFGAYLIDAIILFIAQMIIMVPFGVGLGATGSDTAAGAGVLLMYLIIFVGQWLYFALMESSAKQGTLGKMALGLVVTDDNGQRISFMRATGRYFGKILSSIILLIGYIMAAFTEKKQALHDMLASTLVWKGQPGQVGQQADVFR
ncbi:RDD family protein [Qipengyuania sp. JC766]|uniref:RDD family protein n=1 Tax=Qipengyuania sp. JC766 TaxID=3232139 RepID=UPI00345889AB